jgi:hypothetical protein
MLTLPQQPRSIMEILSASFELYIASFTKVIGYSLIIFACQTSLSVHIINAIGDASSGITEISATDTSMSVEEVEGNQQQLQIQTEQTTQKAQAMQQAIEEATSGLTGIQMVLVLLSTVLYGAMFYRIDNVANRREDEFVGTLLPAVKKLHLLVIAGLLYGIAVIIGIFLLVIPGLILAVSLLFFGCLILLEDQGIFESLANSHRLVWGNWWRTNIVFFIPAFILSIILSVFFFVIFSSAYTDIAATPDDLSSMTGILTKIFVGTGVLNTIIAPYFVVLAYLQYQDLKLRNNL